MIQNGIRSKELVREALREACGRRETLILVTPYLRFQSQFLRLEEDAFHAAVTMSHEEATFGLRNTELKVRFPHRLNFLEASVSLLGMGRVDGKPTLRLAVPEVLLEGEQRSGYRVEHVGRVAVTFSTRKYELITGSLVNISTGGARIHSLRDFEDGEVALGDALAVTVPLTESLRFDTRALVRYVQGRDIGMEFKPVLADAALVPLSRWVFLRREEDLAREANRLSAEMIGQGGGAFGTGGFLLVSTDAALEELLRERLAGLPALVRVPPAVQAMKSAVSEETRMVFFHVPAVGLDERRRLKTLAEFLGGRVPFMVLGREADTQALFEVGSELKAAGVFALGPKPSTLFRRMVEGILRRYGAAEAGL